MKAFISLVLSLLICSAALAETTDLGWHVFYNDEGAIAMAVDASVAVRKLDSPYVMFRVYMIAKGRVGLEVNRNDVVMIYNGQEYKMPSITELRDNYNDQEADTNLLNLLGREDLVLLKMKFYRFPDGVDFFPTLRGRQIATDQGAMSNMLGFKTRIYFKNPGFKKGDTIVIKVNDVKNPELIGFCAVKLE